VPANEPIEDRHHPGTRAASPAAAGALMTRPHHETDHDAPIPLGQRLFDNMFLLLAAGLFVMVALYTGWGLWEITSLPTSSLP
jgi:hypothetical protein